MNTPGKASLPVIKRLPKYYRYLRTLKNDGITSISSRELAAQMGTTASQVRQDFNCIGDVNGRTGHRLLGGEPALHPGAAAVWQRRPSAHHPHRLRPLGQGRQPLHHHRHQRLQADRCLRQLPRRGGQGDQRRPDPARRPAGRRSAPSWASPRKWPFSACPAAEPRS